MREMEEAVDSIYGKAINTPLMKQFFEQVNVQLPTLNERQSCGTLIPNLNIKR
jgi:hypothetical protein